MLELKKLAAGVACATMALALSSAGAAAAAESLSPAIPGVSAASLVAPMPDQGPVAGGTDVTVTAPRGVTFTQIVAGGFHSLALANDGKIYSWGSNDYGQLGDGTITEQHESVQVQGPAGVRFTQIAGGLYYSVALGDDGNTYAWGDNPLGQLGDGTVTGRDVPVPVVFPGVAVVTDVFFGGVAGTNLRDIGNGNYTVTTPAHVSCAVDVSLAWTLNGVVQTPVVYQSGFTYLGVPAVTDPTAQSVAEGGSAVFTSSAAGCPVASPLVWEVSTDGGATWGSVAALAQAVVSADGTSLSIDATPFAFDGYLFRSVATNTEGVTVSAAAGLAVSEAITVSLNANGGTGTMADLVGVAGAAVTLPTSTFTRAGYVFAGWNTAADGSGTAYADAATLTFPDAAVTLYAQWTLQPTQSPSVSPSSQAPNALPTTGSNIAGPLAGVGVLIAAGLGLLVVRFCRRKAGVRVTN